MYYIDIAGIAQSVEQRTENPCVTSSNLVPGKIKEVAAAAAGRIGAVLPLDHTSRRAARVG